MLKKIKHLKDEFIIDALIIHDHADFITLAFSNLLISFFFLFSSSLFCFSGGKLLSQAYYCFLFYYFFFLN